MDLTCFNKTPASQWLDLISSAESHFGYQLTHSIKNYLVMTLQHYTPHLSLPYTIIGEEYLRAIAMKGSQQGTELRRIGDECLILTGLFPGKIQKKNVSLNYTINIGKQSYLQLSHNPQLYTVDPGVFHELEHHFVGLVDVLYMMRHLN